MLFGEVLADIFPDRTVLGGAPFNVARHLKAFGLNPVLVTRLGHDALRETVLEALAQNGMETYGVQCGNTWPTGQVQVHMENGGHRFEILPEQAYDHIHPAMARMAALSAHPSLVYFGTLAQRHDISRRALKNLLRDSQGPRFLDINLRAPWYDEKIVRQSLQYADVVKLNQEELARLAVLLDLPGNDPQRHVRELMDRHVLERIIVTCGEFGAWQISRNGKKIEAQARHKIPALVDTVGAGDGFAAVWIAGTLRRWPLSVTLERANDFAAAVCGIRGAVPDHQDFYLSFRREWEL